MPVIARIAVIGVVCLHFITNLYAREETGASTSFVASEVLASELNLANLPQLVQADERVTAYLEQFTRYGRPETEALLGRATVYFPVFSAALQEKGLPETFKFLPVVESNLRPEVESSRGAAGIWQFMPATARYYGLEVNEQVDQRKDIEAATEAATTMLAELMERFGDWKLALAAYNCGPSRVKRAIRKAGSRDFQNLRPYLPRQTRHYIDKFIAVCHLGQTYSTYGLTPRIDPDLAIQFSGAVEIKGRFQVRDLAEAANLAPETLLQLNPHLPAADIPLRLSGELRVPLFAQSAIRDYLSAQAGANQMGLMNQLRQVDWQKVTRSMVQRLTRNVRNLPGRYPQAESWAVLRRSWFITPQPARAEEC